jgi:polyphosphate kinase
VEALLDARDEDTQVAVLVELKARFDEEPNIVWARQLEGEGVTCRTVWSALTTHAKLCLIVRRDDSGLRRYVHLGTAITTQTLHGSTPTSPTSPTTEIANDVSDLFIDLTGLLKKRTIQQNCWLRSHLRQRLLALIEEQREQRRRGESARITMKLNSLTDQR